MDNLLNKEIMITVFNNFSNEAINKLNSILVKIENEFNRKNFKLLDFLQLNNLTNKKYIDNLEDKKNNVLYELNNINVSSEDELNEKVSEIVKLLKDIDNYLKAPNEYRNIKENLKKEKDYNEINLINKVQEDVSNIMSNLFELLLASSDDYGKGYIKNLNRVLNQFETEKCLSRIMSLFINLMEELLLEEGMKKSINERKNRGVISFQDIHNLLMSYQASRKQENKKIYTVQKIKLNLKFDVIQSTSNNKSSNIEKLYRDRFSRMYLNEYYKILDKYLKEVR